jgi:hypothetical protein
LSAPPRPPRNCAPSAGPSLTPIFPHSEFMSSPYRDMSSYGDCRAPEGSWTQHCLENSWTPPPPTVAQVGRRSGDKNRRPSGLQRWFPDADKDSLWCCPLPVARLLPVEEEEEQLSARLADEAVAGDLLGRRGGGGTPAAGSGAK